MQLEDKAIILMNELGKDFSERGHIFKIFLSKARWKLTSEEIDDTLQDFIVSMGTGGHTYNHEIYEGMKLNKGPIFSWLMSCWNRQIIATLRKKKRKILTLTGNMAEGNCHRISRDRIEGDLEEREYSALYKALEELTPEQRRVIGMHYFQGLQLKKISQRLGLRESTIKGRLYEARKNLKETLPYLLVPDYLRKAA